VSNESDLHIAKAHSLLAQVSALNPATHAEAIVHVAYYAMFHAATGLLLATKGTAPRRHTSVVGEIGLLVKAMGENGRRQGRAFNRAHDLRVLADYAVEGSVLAETARELVVDARAFIEFCEREARKQP
jgi:uncharacterized protein (UPF0332 family)